MFCPKCGTKNPDDGKFCRKCGTDLAPVTQMLSGVTPKYTSSKKKRGRRNHTWESAMGKLFSGFAFLLIAIILGVTGAAGGHVWWYWLLIPAFSMIGAGVAGVLHITRGEAVDRQTAETRGELVSASARALSEGHADYVSPEVGSGYETGDLVPPSVVEKTTRHLEIDREGKTMTLPKTD